MYKPAKLFLSLRALGAPANVLMLAVQGIFRGFKDTKTPVFYIGNYQEILYVAFPSPTFLGKNVNFHLSMWFWDPCIKRFVAKAHPSTWLHGKNCPTMAALCQACPCFESANMACRGSALVKAGGIGWVRAWFFMIVFALETSTGWSGGFATKWLILWCQITLFFCFMMPVSFSKSLGLGNLSAVALLPLLIYGFQLGITGAAISTVVSQ